MTDSGVAPPTAFEPADAFHLLTCTRTRGTVLPLTLTPEHFNRPQKTVEPTPAPPITSDNARVAACDPTYTRDPRRQLQHQGTESLLMPEAGLAAEVRPDASCHPREVPKGNGAAPERGRVHPSAPVEPVDPSRAAPTAKRADDGILRRC